MLTAFLGLLFSFFVSFVDTMPQSFENDNEVIEDSPKDHVPTGGLMDCIQCPSYCIWGNVPMKITKSL